ncbi:hypothetical protein FACS1894166_09900 [Bacilli bacterium]|nr:hypothetical protein FACS1894166_09900 [Bacilli bacterium]
MSRPKQFTIPFIKIAEYPTTKFLENIKVNYGKDKKLKSNGIRFFLNDDLT